MNATPDEEDEGSGTRSSLPRRLARWAVFALAAVVIAAAHGPLTRSPALVVVAGLAAFATFAHAVIDAGAARVTPRELWTRFVASPARVLAGTFAALSLVAAVLLALPVSDARGAGHGWIDAAFTAVSAACVTGLVVLDTPHAFSAVGEGVLLLTLQLGGLGIMVFYALVFALVGARLSLREERTLASMLQVGNRSPLLASVRQIVGATLALELAGAAVLAVAFVGHGDDPGRAMWRGLFTAVSAFCNAGFALQTDSLVRYARDPVVLHVVAALIVAGGLSPAVLAAAPRLVRERRATAHVGLVLATSGGLLVVAFLLVLVFEWDHALAGLSVWDRFHNAWLQSATLRTAGFNSVELGETTPATRTLMMVWMFIGGSPGGTAGGVKTTAVAVVALTVVATMRQRPHTVALRRRIPTETVYEAASVVGVGLATGFVALLALQLTESLPVEHALFEVVSALATCGLSLGATQELGPFGKLVVMACMFAGRVGPLTLVLLVAGRPVARNVTYPEAEVEIG